MDKLEKLVSSGQISKYELLEGTLSQTLTLYFPNGQTLYIDGIVIEHTTGIGTYSCGELEIY